MEAVVEEDAEDIVVQILPIALELVNWEEVFVFSKIGMISPTCDDISANCFHF